MPDQSFRDRAMGEGIVAFLAAAVVGLTYLAVDKITAKPLYTIIFAVTSASFLIIIWMYLYKRKAEHAYRQKLSAIGIKEIHLKFTDAPSVLEVISHAKKTVEFLGISARTFFESEDTEEIIKARIRAGVNFRFLVLDPNSTYVTLKASDEGSDAAAWTHDINGSLARINQLQKETSSDRISAKTYDAVPVWRTIFIDDNIGYITYYPHGHRGKYCPVMVVENRDISVFEPLHDYCKFLWDKGTDTK